MGIPKRLGAHPDKAAFRAWKSQEKSVAERVGGRTTARSGAGSEKGDVRKPALVAIECKSTQAKSFSISLEMIEKLEKAALQRGEMPVFHIQFVNSAGRPIKEVCVLPGYAIDLITG